MARHQLNPEEGNVWYIMGGAIAVLLTMGFLDSIKDRVHSLTTPSVPANVQNTGVKSSLEQPAAEGEK